MSPSQPQLLCIGTWAKNASQHPGQVVLNAQPKQRSTAVMGKVRSEEQFKIQLTEQKLHATLKKVARIQDHQQVEDAKADIPKVAPSLHRQET
ncbi:hypothetical protein EI94DRAFT_1620299 [Lactarius quietus]|nr:hypothetical protein EI94DRAFT_1620299 [Lactarius quietus]